MLIEYSDGDKVLVRGDLSFEEEKDIGVVWGKITFAGHLIHKFSVATVLTIRPSNNIPEHVLFVRTDKNGEEIQFIPLSDLN